MKSQNINILRWDLFKGYPVNTGITTRTGGFSKPPYTTFNLALHTGDSPIDVTKNREVLCKYLNIDITDYCCVEQVHGNHIEVIEIHSKNLVCDGLITKSRKPLLNIFIADCVPIAIFDKKLNIGALCHCGWKGTYSELLPKMINMMQSDYNSNPQDILIGIGPSIGECCYNVSEDLYKKFTPEFGEGYIKKGKFFLNLKEINRKQALTCGVLEKNIEVMEYCTSCSNDLFFSYRKEGEPSGRFSCFLNITS